QRLPKRPAHHHPNILDSVMVIYMQIARGLDLQVEEAMAREALQHVIEERNSRLCVAAPCPVEFERHRDRSLARLSLDLRAALRLGRRQPRNHRPRGLTFILQADL